MTPGSLLEPWRFLYPDWNISSGSIIVCILCIIKYNIYIICSHVAWEELRYSQRWTEVGKHDPRGLQISVVCRVQSGFVCWVKWRQATMLSRLVSRSHSLLLLPQTGGEDTSPSRALTSTPSHVRASATSLTSAAKPPKTPSQFKKKFRRKLSFSSFYHNTDVSSKKKDRRRTLSGSSEAEVCMRSREGPLRSISCSSEPDVGIAETLRPQRVSSVSEPDPSLLKTHTSSKVMDWEKTSMLSFKAHSQPDVRGISQPKQPAKSVSFKRTEVWIEGLFWMYIPQVDDIHVVYSLMCWIGQSPKCFTIYDIHNDIWPFKTKTTLICMTSIICCIWEPNFHRYPAYIQMIGFFSLFSFADLSVRKAHHIM